MQKMPIFRAFSDITPNENICNLPFSISTAVVSIIAAAVRIVRLLFTPKS